MATENLNLRKKMIVNTLSNYGKLVIGMMITIFLTRILFLGLSRSEYGFWALLWSIFGYSLLLDFGFGASIQKYTSESVVTKDWLKFNKIVSTVFFNYAFVSIIIMIVSVILAFNIQHIFTFDAEYTEYYRKALLVFGLGTSLVFPIGFFTEILRGMQALHLRNIVEIIVSVLNFAGMLCIVYLFKIDKPLIWMAVTAIGTNFISSLLMGIISHRLIPEFKIKWKYYDRKLLKSVMSFSVYAYLITFTNLIIFRTDQLVISVFGSVALVSIYQISSRLAETFRSFSKQFLDNLGPVSATLFAAGNKSKMAEIMTQSTRLMGVISTLFLVPLLVYVKPLLKIWLELTEQAGIIVAIILLISMYVLLFYRSTSVYMLLMANEQKKLTKIALIECVANLVLSIFLIHYLESICNYFGFTLPDNGKIIGVALGTLIPNIILAITFNIPVAVKFCETSVIEFFKASIIKTQLAGIVYFAVAVALYFFVPPTNIWIILLNSTLSAIVYLVLFYIIGFAGWEKEQLNGFIKKKLKIN
jgi:O-antigen/teichoic acid export membrane protein